MSTNLILEYSFPDLGHISAPLIEESKELYYLLDSKTKPGICYFQNLAHLGKLTEVYKGAHHSRWEYIFLQIYLIHELCEKKSGLGLSTEIKVDGIKISSIAELLKCWVLLTNFGHIYGVFESERVWFEILNEHNDIRECFISALPEAYFSTYATRIFKEEEYYHLYYLLSAIFLNGIAKYRNVKKLETFICILEAFLKPAKVGSKIENAKGIYRRIRQACYTLLDLNFSTSAIKINSNLLFKNILNNPEQFLFDDEYHLNRALESLSTCLFQEIYASVEATKFKFHYIKSQLKDFNELLCKRGKKYFIKGKKAIFDRMLEYRGHDLGKFNVLEEYNHELRLSLLPNEMGINRTPCKNLNEQNILEKTVKDKTVKVFITPTFFLNNEGCFVDYFLDKNTDTKKVPSVILWASIKYVLESYRDWLFSDDLFHFATSNVLEQLFRYSMKMAVGTEMIVKFIMGTSLEDYNVCLISGKKKLKQWVKQERREIKENSTKLSSSRIWELESIRKIISKEKEGYFLVSKSDIITTSKSGKYIAEIDGVYFNISRKKAKMYLIEAKKVQKGSKTKCKEELRKKIKNLGIGKTSRIYIRTYGKRAYAYCKYEI
jgi:hypothetical protein